jgi:hypothetical protein
VLDGYSRFIVHWNLRESMTEAEMEVILLAAREKRPPAKAPPKEPDGPRFRSFVVHVDRPVVAVMVNTHNLFGFGGHWIV